MTKPSIGRLVHYVQKRSWDDQLTHLPAVITSVWSDTCVNLQVFTDGANSEKGDSGNPPSLKWVTSVMQDESGTLEHSWHWPEVVQ